MNATKETIEMWIDYLNPVYYKQAHALPVILSGTKPDADVEAVREYRGTNIVWFYYPLNVMTYDDWFKFLMRNIDVEVMVTTAQQISLLFDLPETVEVPDVFLVYMEKRKL